MQLSYNTDLYMYKGHNTFYCIFINHLYRGTFNFLFPTDTMIRNGDVELKAREEEIRFLKMEVTN